LIGPILLALLIATTAADGVDGELVEADFIQRTGQYRAIGTGRLVDFALGPTSTVLHLDAEADLRDIPLGTVCRFEPGSGGRVATVRDEFTRLARSGVVYRFEGVAVGKLEVSLGGERRSLAIGPKARIFRGKGEVEPDKLTVGDELLVNLAGPDGHVADAFAGAEARTLATDRQRAAHGAFLKARGLAARIERVEGRRLTVAPIGDPASLSAFCKAEGIDPAKWAAERRRIDAVVANEELRTYNPPVDRKGSRVLEYRAEPQDAPGLGGFRWVIEPELLLEGFRKGRIIRLFAHHAWPVADMPFGEGVYTESPGLRQPIEEPGFYPYRTDFANPDLPWFRPKPGEFPPLNSHHLALGELLEVDTAARSGRFRLDGSAEVVAFTMPPYGIIWRSGAEASLADLPIGTRLRFSLHQDARGDFTRATVIEDDTTALARDDLMRRIEAIDREGGVLTLALRHGPVRNEIDALVQPPDTARGLYAIGPATVIEKEGRRIEAEGLAIGDLLRVETTGRTATGRGVLTEVRVGLATYQKASESQRAKHETWLRAEGLPGWVERVTGDSVSVVFFAGDRRRFRHVTDTGPRGDAVALVLVDEALRPIAGPPGRYRFQYQVFEDPERATEGSSGVRWGVGKWPADERFQPGRLVRAFREAWSTSGP